MCLYYVLYDTYKTTKSNEIKLCTPLMKSAVYDCIKHVNEPHLITCTRLKVNS